MNNTQRLMTEYRKQFYLAYHKKVLPILKRFELKKKEYFSKIFIVETVIFLIIAILFAFWGAFCSANWPLFAVLGAVAIICVPYYFNSKFVKELKTYCLKPILDIFGNITWKEKAIDSTDLEQSELFSAFNRRITDDGFEGEYKGVNFEIAETLLGKESGYGKRRRYRQVFKGVVIKFASNKQIGAKTIVTTKGDMYTRIMGYSYLIISALVVLFHSFSVYTLKGDQFVTVFSIILFIVIVFFVFKTRSDKAKKNQLLSKIHLEDPLFEKKFNAYSTNEIEGRYLITTAFMERFINLKTAFGAKKAKCAFYNDSIMFAITTNKNLFEIGNLFSKLENPKQIDEFFNEFASILLLVEHFKLDQKTGL